MAVIAFCQHRLGRTDGVSLEVDKWRRVLEKMGHTVHYISGNEDVPGGNYIPELYPFHPTTNKILKNATVKLEDYNENELLNAIREHSAVVKSKMKNLLDKLGVEVLIPNNLLSVGYNLPGMLALSEILKETKIPAISHNHDFWWEDSGEVDPTCEKVIELYKEHAPPDYPNIRHCVINRLAQNELKQRKGIEARVVPNVFDFNQPEWKSDEYNQDFRKEIGIGKNDIMFLQATRILDRKGVEMAIDLIASLQLPENRKKLEDSPLYDGRKFGPDDEIVLVCAGYVEGIGLSGGYQNNLQTKAAESGVKIVWCGDRVKHERGHQDGQKSYCLWDSYVSADFVTYPSIWEGWGNQFIEAIYAKLPVFIFEYPVYVSDLSALGFNTASLGSETAGKDKRGLIKAPAGKLNEATSKVMQLLIDADQRKAVTTANFEIARQNFSLEALQKIIEELMEEVR